MPTLPCRPARARPLIFLFDEEGVVGVVAELAELGRWALGVDQLLDVSLVGKALAIAVVGPTGVGKSALLNTLLTEKLFEDARQVQPSTLDMSRRLSCEFR